MIEKEYNYSFLSKTGQKIWVRAMRPDDAPLLVDVFNHMTSESRYRRFHQTLDHVPTSRIWREAENITQADPDLNYGLLALADLAGVGAMPIGAVRYVGTVQGEAEVAISIRDDFQNMGIGTHIMRLITDEAQALGYYRLTANIQNDNQAVWQVFNKLPYRVIRTPKGTYSDITIYLSPNKG